MIDYDHMLKSYTQQDCKALTEAIHRRLKDIRAEKKQLAEDKKVFKRWQRWEKRKQAAGYDWVFDDRLDGTAYFIRKFDKAVSNRIPMSEDLNAMFERRPDNLDYFVKRHEAKFGLEFKVGT